MPSEQRLNKKMRFTNSFVTIKATLDGKTESFHVHEDTIKERSKYFRAAFDRRWQEGKTREIELHEDGPDTVSAYLEFVYSGSVSSAAFTTEKEENDEIIMRLIRLYVFGEKIQDDDFCDKVLRTLGTRCDEEDDDGQHWYPIDVAIRSLYDGTPSNSPARRFLVELHVQLGYVSFLEADIDKHHPEFLLDLARRLMQDGKTHPYPSSYRLAKKCSKKQ